MAEQTFFEVAFVDESVTELYENLLYGEVVDDFEYYDWESR